VLPIGRVLLGGRVFAREDSRARGKKQSDSYHYTIRPKDRLSGEPNPISCPLWHLRANRQEMAGTRPVMT